jgi:hypothetical protein
MKFLDIARRLRFRIRRRPKARLPILTWEEINEDARAELVEQLEREVEEELSEFEQSLRNPN